LSKGSFVLHLIPSGILHGDKICVIGQGVVLDPRALLDEVTSLEEAGVKVNGNLLISNRAHLILPYHRALEQAAEYARGDRKIGTTSRGIGPAYEDKTGRRGLRVIDLFDAQVLKDIVFNVTKEKNCLMQSLYHAPPLDPQAIFEECLAFAPHLEKFVVDTSQFLNAQIRAGKHLAPEGAQGPSDIDHGTFRTSRFRAGGRSLYRSRGSPVLITGTLGIAKAYTVLVGRFH
jgi:adenylosuccinate synthase